MVLGGSLGQCGPMLAHRGAQGPTSAENSGLLDPPPARDPIFGHFRRGAEKRTVLERPWGILSPTPVLAPISGVLWELLEPRGEGANSSESPPQQNWQSGILAPCLAPFWEGLGALGTHFGAQRGLASVFLRVRILVEKEG